MYIDRIFTVKGFGSVVTGSVISGEMKTGQDVFLLPGNFQKLRVRSIERHGQVVDKVVAGDRAAVNLIGLKNEDFSRGMLITSKKNEPTNMIDAQIKLFDVGFSIPLWSNITFISGTFECQARMHVLNKEEIQSSEEAIVQIHLNKPNILMSKDRFIMRNSSADITLGGGYVIDAAPLHHKKRTPKLTDYLNQLSQNILSEQSTSELIRLELKKEFRPFTFSEVVEKLNMKTDELKSEIDKGSSGITHYKNNENEILIESNYNNLIKERIIKFIQEHHAKNALFPAGLDINELSGKLNFTRYKHGKSYIEMVLLEMKDNIQLDTYKNTWIMKGHKAVLDKQSEDEKNLIENLILKYDTEKPMLSEIEEKAALNKINSAKTKTYIAILALEGKIRYFQNDFIHNSILDKYRIPLLRKLGDNENGIGIQEYKELLGGTKRFRAYLTDIYEAEKIISIKRENDSETRFCITSVGINLLK